MRIEFDIHTTRCLPVRQAGNRAVAGGGEPGLGFTFQGGSYANQSLASSHKKGNGISDDLVSSYVRYALSQDSVQLDSIADVLNRASNSQYQLRLAALLSRVIDSSSSQKSSNFQLSKEGNQFLKFQADLKGAGKIKQLALRDPQHQYHLWALADERSRNGTSIPAPLQLPQRKQANRVDDLSTSIDNLSGSFSVYPSPAREAIWVKSDEFEGYIEVRLYNLNGKTVKRINSLFSQNLLIEVSDLPSGMYFLRMSNQHEVFQQEKISIVK